ncbi:hypothetical protein OBBRIDRAFT_445498 [Obba rivulosa]|uniref:Aminoglycoside phosphotransferase domain-containing protein n=1 Tax=Obba rivulosa TaxID=1052685 RepID=A0A8E2DU00_9APHY|nr:hypothetical protein OBBRIDRAFT_445498 [Obba rivulosa]
MEEIHLRYEHDCCDVTLRQVYTQAAWASHVSNVREIAGIMKLARTVVPVPKVYDCGYSGDCSYILMQAVRGDELGIVIQAFPEREILPTHPFILDQVEKVVKRLASVGISHNDLEPRNIIVDNYCRFTGIIDWDNASPWHLSCGYLGRIRRRYPLPGDPQISHPWDTIILEYSPDTFYHLWPYEFDPLVPRCYTIIQCKYP